VAATGAGLAVCRAGTGECAGCDGTGTVVWPFCWVFGNIRTDGRETLSAVRSVGAGVDVVGAAVASALVAVAVAEGCKGPAVVG